MMCVVARLALLLAAWLAALQLAAGCSCMLGHPQDQFCRANYVILTRVKKEIVTDRDRVYRTVVKRIFKASEKDAVSLSAGKIWTSLHDSMCGVRLETNRTYVLAGQLSGGKAHINLCDLYLPWDSVTPKQRKGFRLMYRQSCHCKVRVGNQGTPTDSDTCQWWTSFLGPEEGPDCQGEHAICMRQPGSSTHGAHCGWTGGSRYRQCMEDRRRLREPPKILPQPEPPKILPQPEPPKTLPHLEQQEPEITPQPEVIHAPEPRRRRAHEHLERTPRRT
ncbi:tissue inhibitor of metalloproteinase isoform X1 [Schistocerca gregaria]|uniref:tissue inhibitor of metalloproteinase isoform X1 n=2 Tax=Schistocerca gregaria TaxID=7010 RepID=UPI00211DE009|nr:tissue inhibitor of metalloproteinase isoform X1 [Schistocerca gregaria]